MFTIFTIFNLRDGAQSLELMFWISALNGTISPGTYPDLSNLISPEIAQTAQVFLMKIPYLTLFGRHNVSGFNKDY